MDTCTSEHIRPINSTALYHHRTNSISVHRVTEPFIRKESISNQGSLLGNLSSRSTVSEEWKGNMRMRGGKRERNRERVERNVSTYLIVPTRNVRNAESGTRARLRLTR